MSPAIELTSRSTSTFLRRSPSTLRRAPSMSRSTFASLPLIVVVSIAPACSKPAATPETLRPALQQLRSGFDAHRDTLGATETLTIVKHGVRDWVDARLGAAPQTIDTRAFAGELHAALRDGKYLCLDMAGDCPTNPLG